MQGYPFIFPILVKYLLEVDKFLYSKTARPGAIFSEKWIGRKLVNINPKIIERVYIVKLLIFRVNVVSILGRLNRYGLIYTFLPFNWNEFMIFIETQYVIFWNLQTGCVLKIFNLHLINQNRFFYVFVSLLITNYVASKHVTSF